MIPPSLDMSNPLNAEPVSPEHSWVWLPKHKQARKGLGEEKQSKYSWSKIIGWEWGGEEGGIEEEKDGKHGLFVVSISISNEFSPWKSWSLFPGPCRWGTQHTWTVDIYIDPMNRAAKMTSGTLIRFPTFLGHQRERYPWVSACSAQWWVSFAVREDKDPAVSVEQGREPVQSKSGGHESPQTWDQETSPRKGDPCQECGQCWWTQVTGSTEL